MASPYLPQRGRRKAPHCRSREDATANLRRQQFFDTDRVKEFHRQILLAQTLKERAEQIELKRQLENAAREENRKLMEQVRRKQLEDTVRGQQSALQRELERKSVAEYVKQQIQEKEMMRQQKQLDKEMEEMEWQQRREQYEWEMMMLKHKEREQKIKTRMVYAQQVLNRDAARAHEEDMREMEEERRKRFVMEKEKWTAMVREMEADRRNALQRRKDLVAQVTAAQMQEESRKREEEAAKALASGLAKQQAKLEREEKERNGKKKAMLDAMAAQRESNRRHREQVAREEKEWGSATLQAMKEDELMFREHEWLKALKKRQDHCMLNEERRQQIALKRAMDLYLKEEETAMDARNADLISSADAQFEDYTAAVISAAAEAGLNILPLCKAAQKGVGCGIDPVYGRRRANYIVPGATCAQMPEYISRTAQHVDGFQRNQDYESTKARLGFIW